MSLGKTALSLFDYLCVQIQAPIVIMLNAVTRTHQKAADVAAEIQDLATLPHRACQYFIKVAKLCFAC